jgi:DNA-binding NtrC family response regulator
MPALRDINKKQQALKPVYVYIVEDEPLLLELLDTSLSHAGIHHRAFSDPLAALATFEIEAIKPDLLITDYQMGRSMTGVDLIFACKKIEPALKAILASGTITSETALKSGAPVSRFIPKPYKPTQIIEAIHRLFPNRSPASETVFPQLDSKKN